MPNQVVELGVDLTDARDVACAWSSIVEPGDEVAGRVRRVVGAASTLYRLGERAHADGFSSAQMRGLDLTYAQLETAWQRWQARLGDLNLEASYRALERAGGWVIYPGHPHWPTSLDDLGDAAPVCLWGIGDLGNYPRISVVGARACTRAGEYLTRSLSWELAKAGYSVVSGGAFGIDIAAHRAAIEIGHTIAVMAGGVNQLYPVAHRQDFQRLIDSGGAVISEVPPAWRPARWRFLARNRAIAALSQATVVVEASLRSGALATLRRAQELGRGVGAYPGPVTSNLSQGCHEAIRNGVTLVTGVADVLELVQPIGQSGVQAALRATDELEESEQRVYDALPKYRPASARSVAKAGGLSTAETLAILGKLALRGYVMVDGEQFQRSRRQFDASSRERIPHSAQ